MISPSMFNLRPATLSDSYAIARVHIETWKKAYAGLVPDDFLSSLSVRSREGIWRKILSKRNTKCLLAEHEAQVIGFVDFGASRDDSASRSVGEVYALYLHPDYWSQGVGRSLCTQAVETLIEEEYQTITLWVLDANKRARRFYEKFGFKLQQATKKERVGTLEAREVLYQYQVVVRSQGKGR